jgi:excisionase family DNA binding protein
MRSIVRPLAVRIREACEMTGLGRTKLLELTYAGIIESFKVGRSRLWPVAGLERWVDSQTRHAQEA